MKRVKRSESGAQKMDSEIPPKNTKTRQTLPLSAGFVTFEVVDGRLKITAYDAIQGWYRIYGATDSTSQVADLAEWLNKQAMGS